MASPASVQHGHDVGDPTRGQPSSTGDDLRQDDTDTGPAYERVDLDRYVILHEHRSIGYVDVVSPVFVCYLGAHYPFAVEVAQVYDFELAVQTVQHAATGN